jgi:hypothetical protein
MVTVEPDYGSQWIGNVSILLAFCVVLFCLWVGEHVYARHQVRNMGHEDDAD